MDTKKMVAGLTKVIECKGKMVERGLTAAKAHCPYCDGKNTLFIALARNGRSKSGFHVHWHCNSCNFGGME